MNCLSPVYLREKRMHVPCGKCLPCRARKSGDWAFRLMQEWKYSSSSYFVTLTYEDKNLFFNSNGVASVNKEHLQLYFKRLRHKSPFRYYAVAEYGPTTFRPHYHLLLFNYDADIDFIASEWNLGHVKVDSMNEARVRYCAIYSTLVTKVPDGGEPVFSLMSRRPGIGLCYLSPQMKRSLLQKRELQVSSFGRSQPMPRYYKDKVFPDITLKVLGEVARRKGEQAMYEFIDRLKIDYGDEWGFRHQEAIVECVNQLEKKLIKTRKI